MAEIKKVWVVRDGAESDLDDPAIKSWPGDLEENILAQFMWEMDVDQFIHVVVGGGPRQWFDENSGSMTMRPRLERMPRLASKSSGRKSRPESDPPARLVALKPDLIPTEAVEAKAEHSRQFRLIWVIMVLPP